MSFVKVNGIKICYEIYGKDDNYPIILIHGYGGKQSAWIAQIPDLSKKYKVITFDLRGTGKSDRPNIPYTMEMLAGDINGLMNYLQIDKAHLGGRSLGGMIAQNFALIYPERVNKLILITTTPGFPDKQAVELTIKGRSEAYETLKNDPVKAFWQQAIMVYYQKFRKEMESNPKKKFHGIWSVEDLIKDGAINPTKPQDIKNLGNAIKNHDVFDRLNEIKNKTLLLAASHDRLCPKSTMIGMSEKIPNSTIKIIEKAGHFITLSRAPEVNKILIEFLDN